jgi:hypothetical protein
MVAWASPPIAATFAGTGVELAGLLAQPVNMFKLNTMIMMKPHPANFILLPFTMASPAHCLMYDCENISSRMEIN